MEKVTTHEKQLVSLRRIEGQVRGIQKMIEDKRYCIDILTQLHSIIGAIHRVEDNILEKHLEGCVSQALKKGATSVGEEKIEEIITLLKSIRK